MLKKTVTIGMANGLDANEIAVLVQKSCKYSASVHLQIGTKKVNAKSIMGMLNICEAKGTEITLICDGSDEEKALNDIAAYIESGK
ncbi:MAG TPA: HPr family phosphocarrier protein [Lachnospiraceae bacterium]|jgi:phosphotransferase system HPr (HPr) family protein|nr:HPr family phosphocarrier protein [Lachnospiraceae bacterium]